MEMDNLDYGIIGNCRSAALVSKRGSLDWCCLPEFDSPSVFAKLLDREIGGSFEVVVGANYTIEQKYIRDTAILLTRFSDGNNIFEVLDFMPRYRKGEGPCYAPPEIIRYIRHVSGQPTFRVTYNPRLEYALGKTETFIKENFIASLTHEIKFDTIFLYTSFDYQTVVDGGEMVLDGDGYFLLGYNEKILKPTLEKVYLEMERTKVYWLNWSDEIPIYHKYNSEIRRSALTLKMLSYDKSGAVLAAATTSLPETIGEVRNWDYRFCWIRDASMTIKVISDLGHKHIAKRYLQFIIDLIPDKEEKLQIMYGINMEKTLTEETLDHLSGYMGSKPVRIGNA
ncbi:MAG TPA: glycoside hydrolase family 15 protein, partial [Arenibacter sp.]|nr:glycoside hydrolase family 15 protein [Arenibacter sp.]